MTTALSLFDPLPLILRSGRSPSAMALRNLESEGVPSSRYAGSGVFCWSTSSALGLNASSTGPLHRLNAGEIAQPMEATDAMISTETKKA